MPRVRPYRNGEGGNIATYHLPRPIPLNAYYAHGGRVRLSDAGRAFREEAGYAALGQGAQPQAGELSVTLRVYNTRMDVDAPLKAALDALNGIAWQDDAQIKRLTVLMLRDDGESRMELEVEAMTEAERFTRA